MWTRGLVLAVDSRNHVELDEKPQAAEKRAATELTELLQVSVLNDRDRAAVLQNTPLWWQTVEGSYVVVRNGLTLELARRIVGVERRDDTELIQALQSLSPTGRSAGLGAGLMGGDNHVIS